MKLLAGLLSAGVLAIACLFAAPAGAACLSSLVVRDGSGVLQQTAAANGASLLHPCHVMEGLSSTGAPTAAEIDADGGLWAHLTNAPIGYALETGHLATIDTSTAAAKADLDTIATNTAPGAAGSGVSPPAGGSGPLGFLSGIYHAVTGTLTIAFSTPQHVIVDSGAPSETNYALETGGNLAGVKSDLDILAAWSAPLTNAQLTAQGLFKAGQSIGNTGFNALQGGSPNSVGNPFYVLAIPGSAIGGGNTPYPDTSTALSASASFTGLARTVPVAAAYFNATFLADQAGTAEIDCSTDGLTFWQCAAPATLVANTASILSVPITTNFVRVRLTNGSTAETVLHITSSFTGG